MRWCVSQVFYLLTGYPLSAKSPVKECPPCACVNIKVAKSASSTTISDSVLTNVKTSASSLSRFEQDVQASRILLHTDFRMEQLFATSKIVCILYFYCACAFVTVDLSLASPFPLTSRRQVVCVPRHETRSPGWCHPCPRSSLRNTKPKAANDELLSISHQRGARFPVCCACV